ncbi:MAG: DMT family transporter [bacterium]|nr:DMT family transporter [bacterium]
MNGLVAAIYSSFFLALGQAALKKSYKELEPSVAFLFEMLFGLFLWIPLCLFFGVNFQNIGQVLIYAVISAILSEALYFYALSKGQLSITAILIGSYPIYTIIFSFLINGERLLPLQIVFIFITILGTLLTYLPSKFSLKELRQSGAIAWPIIAAIGIGLSDTLSKGAINRTGDFSFLFTVSLMQIPVSIIYLKLEKQKLIKTLIKITREKAAYRNAIIGSLFSTIGTGLLWISFSKTLASIASPITATSGAIVMLLAVIFLDEKINLRSVTGLLLVFLGIIGISGQV